jgi:hypothetical protein
MPGGKLMQTIRVQTLDLFLKYEDELSANLQAHPDVIGLVFVGSAADHSRFDEWSDHDFFVVTKSGAGEGLRQDLSWLPNADEIAIRPRETAHGLKVVYRDGHVLEFAVFNDEELELAGANAYLVTVDKTGEIAGRMAAIAAKSAEAAAKAIGENYKPDAEFELFLCQLLIGVGRARRGEALIASEHVRSWAVGNLLGLVRHWQHPVRGTEGKTDNLNRHRRFELQYPTIGARIVSAQEKPVEACAQQLLGVVLEVGGGNLTAAQRAQAAVVSDRLGWS